MGIVDREYSFGIDRFNNPNVINGKDAIGTRLMELMMMEPGDDPLHPDMGVGIQSYRYSINNTEPLRKRIEEQIATYLPFYQGVTVTLIITPDKICNVEIVIEDTTYVYDSGTSSKPIKLSDISTN